MKNRLKKLIIVIISLVFLQGSVILDAQEIEYPLKNARRTNYGFVMMGIPTSDELSSRFIENYINSLQNEGITSIISFHPPNNELYEAILEENIDFFHLNYPNEYSNYWNFHWFLDYDEDWQKPLLDYYLNRNPKTIAINCQHGVDRTGNVVAWLMAVVYQVPLADAFYAVVDNSRENVDNLIEVFEEFGIFDQREPLHPSVSLWAYENRRGMNTYSSGFKRYVRETIGSALEFGAQW